MTKSEKVISVVCALIIVVCSAILIHELIVASILPTHFKAYKTNPGLPDLNLNPPSTGNNNLVELAPEVLQLNKGNTVVFRGVVGPETVAKAQEKLLKMSKELPYYATIYLFLDTPGGDIDAGKNLIDVINSLPQKVNTITLFAASMGFIIVESANKRYVLPNGTLMAHRARVGGVGGQIPGEFTTMAAVLHHEIMNIEKAMAVRLGISYDAYENLVRNEYWVKGSDAVIQGAADRVALLNCDEGLLKSKEDVDVQTFFGTVTLEFNGCPAITGPLGASFSRGIGPDTAPDATKAAMEVLRTVQPEKNFGY